MERRQLYVVQGIIGGIIPLTLLGKQLPHPLLPGQTVQDLLVSAGFLLLLAGTDMIYRRKTAGRILSVAGIAVNVFLLIFECIPNPLLTLLSALAVEALLYYLFCCRFFPETELTPELQLGRVSGSSQALLALTVFSPLFISDLAGFSWVCFSSMIIMLVNILRYCQLRNCFGHPLLCSVIFVFLLAASWGLFRQNAVVLPAFTAAAAVLLITVKKQQRKLELPEMLLQHPARCLMLTFFTLCVTGTLLLRTPLAMRQELSIQEAAFTAVSAACVTGLTTVDIAEKLSTAGLIFLLLLIQLGGLGIMTLTTLALHALGRLTLHQEQMMYEITLSPQTDIFQELRQIVRFTLIVEVLGAIFLSWGFYSVHHQYSHALALGIFTSVSAFCNAGFFPVADNLAPYARESWLLLVIAAEIILGGIAPMVTCSWLRLRSFSRLNFFCKLSLAGTAVLLLSGTFLLLLFEWNGIFREFSIADKLVNGFFLAAALRTAGFSTVDLTSIGIATYLFMNIFMFIGGCPGGTAGGIKVTTLAVLFFILRSAAGNQSTVIAGQRQIAQKNIIQAPAILTAALLILFSAVLMLSVTQFLPVRELFFEAVSALGTVGLSLNTTPQLNTIGQLIIMGAMFVGRIGPLTLFLLFSKQLSTRQLKYPPVNMPLG